MTTLSQDFNNDLVVSNGLLVVAADKDAMGFIIADAIRTITGELQLDIEAGIPYQDTIWESVDKTQIWKHYVEKKVRSYAFVKAVTSFDVVIDGKNLSYKIVVQTDDGEVTVES